MAEAFCAFRQEIDPISTLNWIGKAAVVKHHKEVPFRLLEAVPDLFTGAADRGMIVQGDNLHALKALLPRCAGQRKSDCLRMFNETYPLNVLLRKLAIP